MLVRVVGESAEALPAVTLTDAAGPSAAVGEAGYNNLSFFITFALIFFNSKKNCHRPSLLKQLSVRLHLYFFCIFVLFLLLFSDFSDEGFVVSDFSDKEYEVGSHECC